MDASREYTEEAGAHSAKSGVYQEIQEVLPDYGIGGKLQEWDDEHCEKHQRHKNQRNTTHHQPAHFIPKDECYNLIWFLSDFPGLKYDDSLQCKQLILDVAKCSLPLVGKFEGHCVSSDRPDTFKGGPYALCDHRGQDFSSYGSGYVRRVSQYTERESSQSNQNPQNYWKVLVCTAKHVIFDDTEAKKAKFLLEDEEGREDSIILCGGKVSDSNTMNDYCFVEFMTHDYALAFRLQQAVEQCEEKMLLLKKLLISLIDNPYKSYGPDVPIPVVLISHPHGRQKYVTCGVHLGIWGENHLGLKSDYHSCPGSSGGMVINAMRVLFGGLHMEMTYPHSCATGDMTVSGQDVGGGVDNFYW